VIVVSIGVVCLHSAQTVDGRIVKGRTALPRVSQLSFLRLQSTVDVTASK